MFLVAEDLCLFQNLIKESIKQGEIGIELVNVLAVFSSNEAFEEIATNDIR